MADPKQFSDIYRMFRNLFYSTICLFLIIITRCFFVVEMTWSLWAKVDKIMCEFEFEFEFYRGL